MRPRVIVGVGFVTAALFAVVAGPTQAASTVSQDCRTTAEGGINDDGCGQGQTEASAEWRGVTESTILLPMVTVAYSPARDHRKNDPFTLKWNKVPFKIVGETRMITVENLGAAGKPTALNVVSNPVGAFTVPEEQEEACRKNAYAEVGMAGSTCVMTATYKEKSANCQPIFKLTIKVTPGEGESEIILNG